MSKKLTHDSNKNNYSIEFLQRCIETQKKKGEDYNKNIPQSLYYPRGIDTIYDLMHTKMLRIKSCMIKLKNNEDTNFESITDSVVDLVNYSSFFVSYLNKQMNGQCLLKNEFNEDVNETKT